MNPISFIYQRFFVDVSKLVDDITDYQIGKWEVAAMQGNDFGSEGSNFMHPDLDPEKYVLQVRSAPTMCTPFMRTPI